MSYKYRTISEKFVDIPSVPVITSVNYENDLITMNWNRPTSVDPIINYLIFINKSNSNNDGIYMHLVSDPTCESCSYVINNLNLIPNTQYYVSIIAINANGASPPSLKNNFMTSPAPSPSPFPSPSTSPSLSDSSPNSTSSPLPTIPMTLEESIKMLQNQRKVYLDNELQNMIIRADGVYETNKTELAYPDKYLDDIKQSISTINDSVKKDLQEYRLNIHLASQKNN